MDFALKRPIPLFALAAVASIVGGLCVGAFPVGFADLLSAIGLSTTPIDDTTSVVLYAIRAPRVLAAFCVGAALAAGGAALQSLFRNPLADPGLLGVSSGAALAAVSVIVLGERVMHVIPPDLRPWLLPVAAFGGGLVATTIVYRLAAREGVTLIGTLLLAGIAINAVTSAGIGMLVFVADDQQLRTLIFWTMGGFGGVTWAAIIPALLILAIAVPTLLPAAHLLDALALGEREAGHVGVDVERLKRRLVMPGGAGRRRRRGDLRHGGLRRPDRPAHRAPAAGPGASHPAARRRPVRRRLPRAGRRACPHHRLAGRAADRRADGLGRRPLLPLAAGRPRRAGGTVSTLRAEAIEVRAGTKALITDVSLAVEPGEFLAVIGPNGAGKSTLLSALAGDRLLAKGDVLLDGKPMRRWNKRELAKRRAVLPQHSNVAFDFTGLQVAMLGLLAHRDRLSEPQMRALAEQALGETEALAFADRPYTVLSGGERQRVQLARVLVQCDADPGHMPFLLLDEPIAGLDLSHQHAALASARRRADRGLGVLAVLHDLNMAARYADRVAIMEGGRMTAFGPIAEVLDPVRLSAVFATPIARVEVDGKTAFLSLG